MGMYSKCLVMVVGQYDTISLFNFKYHGDYHFFFSLLFSSLSLSLLTGQSVAQST